jgi:hypothetical protein
MGPVSVNIKFGLVHIFPDLLITRFVHRSRMVRARPKLPIHSSSSLSDGCGRRLHCFLSPVTVFLSEVNAILSSFDADVAQLRDMALNRLIFYPSPDLKVVLHTMSKEHSKTAFSYLPKRVDLHDRNILHFNIIPKLHNELHLMLFWLT